MNGPLRLVTVPLATTLLALASTARVAQEAAPEPTGGEFVLRILDNEVGRASIAIDPASLPGIRAERSSAVSKDGAGSAG